MENKGAICGLLGKLQSAQAPRWRLTQRCVRGKVLAMGALRRLRIRRLRAHVRISNEMIIAGHKSSTRLVRYHKRMTRRLARLEIKENQDATTS